MTPTSEQDKPSQPATKPRDFAAGTSQDATTPKKDPARGATTPKSAPAAGARHRVTAKPSVTPASYEDDPHRLACPRTDSDERAWMPSGPRSDMRCA
jgi:hypothetical protein